MKHNKQNGIAKIFTLITMVLLVAVLGLAMNETQKVQENRSKAAGLSSLPVTPPIALGDRVLNEGKYIDLSLYLEELSSISDKNLNLWLGRLNLAYEDYSELTNWKPHDGNKITIQSVECGDNCPGWAWADSSPVISWAKQWWLIDELKRIDNKDDWSFGILHEISHKFDNYESWGGFDNEMMANFKMAYVLEKRNAKVCPNNDEQYFVVGSFTTGEPRRTEKRFRSWQKSRFPKKFRNQTEMKFSEVKIKDELRLKTLKMISDLDVRINYTYLKRENIPEDYKSNGKLSTGILYTHVVAQTLELYTPTADKEFRVFCDQRHLKGIKRKEFKDIITARLLPLLPKDSCVQIEMVDSTTDANIQIADWISGALARYYEKKKLCDECFDILNNNIISNDNELFKDYWQDKFGNKKPNL